MHRARQLDCLPLDYDWYHPRIRFVGVPRADLTILGIFEQISRQLVTRAAEKAGHVLELEDGWIFMPVHELQLENIKSKFRNVKVLGSDISLAVMAQSGLRLDKSF